MKNQIALPVRQAKESRISLWLKKENRFFTFLLEVHIPEHTRSLSGSLLRHKTRP